MYRFPSQELDRRMGRPVSGEKMSDAEIRRKEKEKLLNIDKPTMPDLKVLLGHLLHGIIPGSSAGAYALASEEIDLGENKQNAMTAGLWMSIGCSIFCGYSINKRGTWFRIRE
jgi:hypothetical protein